MAAAGFSKKVHHKIILQKSFSFDSFVMRLELILVHTKSSRLPNNFASFD